jgi:hypothetical protein
MVAGGHVRAIEVSQSATRALAKVRAAWDLFCPGKQLAGIELTASHPLIPKDSEALREG